MNITEGKLMLGAIFRDKMLLYADVWSLPSFEDRCVEGK